MSIIYDALQKTQRNREYLKLQNTITPHKPPQRNLKWMVLGPFFLILSAGLGGLITFYWPAIDLVQRPQVAAQKSAVIHRPTPIHQAAMAVPKTDQATQTKVLAQSAETLVSALPIAPQAVSVQHEISTAINQGKFVLNGVMISGSERIALINNQPLHVGDVIDGMKIISIEFNAITFMKDQKVVEMKVPV